MMGDRRIILFDWFGTLGVDNDTSFIGEFLGDEGKKNLIVSDLDVADISEENKNTIRILLGKADLSLYEDSFDIVRSLKNKGYTLGIVSNMYPVTTERIRKEFRDFVSHFDIVSLSSELSLRKPSEDIFLDALKKLGDRLGREVSPEEVIMVGDSERDDVETPLRLGMDARLIDRSYQNLRDVFGEVDL